MGRQRKILIYTHSMAGGGAERVCASLASGFAWQGDNVTLAVDFEATDNSGYVGPAVRLVHLGRGHVQNVLELVKLLRREKPDIAMSALAISNLKLLIAAVLTGSLSRTVLSYHGFADNEPRFLSQLSYWLTPLATRITAATVCVSDSLRNYLVQRWWASPKRTLRIYNPVVVRLVSPAPDRDAPLVLAVGRLSVQKDFCALVRAFALVKHPTSQLVILGEGSERAAIEAEVARLSLGHRVSLPGYLDEPWRIYARASCLAVSSQSETFSLVVVEALANGLPIISTCCQGPEEILDHGRFGTIVPFHSDAVFAAAIDAALDNPGNPAPRIARADQFSLEASLEIYCCLFDHICDRAAKADTGLKAGSPLPQNRLER